MPIKESTKGKKIFEGLAEAQRMVRQMTHQRGEITNERKEEIFSFIAGGNSVLDAAKKYEITTSRAYGIIGWKKAQIHNDQNVVRRARGIEQAQRDPKTLPEFEQIDLKAYRAVEVGIVNNAAQKRALIALRWLEGRGKLGSNEKPPVSGGLYLSVPPEWRGRYGVVVEQGESDSIEVSAVQTPALIEGGK